MKSSHAGRRAAAEQAVRLVALGGLALSTACVLDDVPEGELSDLGPPCASGWVASDDGTRCVRAVESAGPGDAGPRDAGPDGGALMADSGVEAPDGGSACFDPASGAPDPDALYPATPVINEYVFVHAEIGDRNTDFFEFVEIYGQPSTPFDDLTLVIVNSHIGSNIGVIRLSLPIGQSNRAGFWRSCTGWMDALDVFPQASSSLFLVRGFSGFTGQDLDPDDDGTLDETPWTEIVDEVGFEDGDAAQDVSYASPLLSNDGFAGHSIVGGRSLAARAIDGIDTNAEEDWRKIAFTGYGLPGVSGAPRPTEAWVTPGEPNRIQP